MDPSKDLTVELIMGLTLTAPPPILSKDPIVPFNAKDANSQDVFTDQDPVHPFLDPKPIFAQDDWNPQARPVGVGDDDEELWIQAQSAWKNPTDLGTASTGKQWGLTDVVGMWGDAMGWKEGVDAFFPSVFVDAIEIYDMSAPFVGI
jgi:hypothetical protein